MCHVQIETNKNTALTLACFQGRYEVVSLLIDRKANIEHRAKVLIILTIYFVYCIYREIELSECLYGMAPYIHCDLYICVLFCRLRKLHLDPQLFLNGNPIPVAEEVNFLGIIFYLKTLISASSSLLKKVSVQKLLTCCVLLHTLCGVQTSKPFYTYTDL